MINRTKLDEYTEYRSRASLTNPCVFLEELESAEGAAAAPIGGSALVLEASAGSCLDGIITGRLSTAKESMEDSIPRTLASVWRITSDSRINECTLSLIKCITVSILHRSGISITKNVY